MDTIFFFLGFWAARKKKKMGIMCSNISEKFVTVYLIIADFSEIVTEPQPNIDIKLLINSVSLIF